VSAKRVARPHCGHNLQVAFQPKIALAAGWGDHLTATTYRLPVTPAGVREVEVVLGDGRSELRQTIIVLDRLAREAELATNLRGGSAGLERWKARDAV
jgi:hypothetical protein